MTPIVDEHTAWRVHPDASTGILVDARDYYRAFYHAASRARRSILLLGWQFDSDVLLVRGEDAPSSDPNSVMLLHFLDRLCRERPDLDVRVLAWDYSVVFALEREALQGILFNFSKSPNLRFRFDDTVPLTGAHHQKVAVIDGRIGFLGSTDICQHRWDTSAHHAVDPLRVSRGGELYGPYHEVQAMLSGEAARSLLDLFVERWHDATGEALDPEALTDEGAETPSVELDFSTRRFPPATVALARGFPARLGRPAIHEVRELLTRALLAAERLVYIETQYFTAQAVLDALCERMREGARPRLNLVIITPERPESMKEEITMGVAQADVLAELVATARDHGHAIGIYNTAARLPTGEDAFVYIHAKLLIVDDRFLTVGSANLNNRSMGFDSELNAAWESPSAETVLGRAIRGLRVSLLAEHAGAPTAGEECFSAIEGLVSRLDEICARGEGRLRHHDMAHDEARVLVRALGVATVEYFDPIEAPESIRPAFEEAP